jgi:hypothetical protein
MRLADLVTASLLMLLGGVVLADALRLGIGWGTDGPKSGFFPFWLAVLLMALCAAILVQAARRGAGGPFLRPGQAGPVLTVLGPAAGLVVLTAFVGLYVASACYLAASMRFIGRYSWPAVLALSVGVPVVVFLVFEQWFLVPMPKGPLEAWLGY